GKKRTKTGFGVGNPPWRHGESDGGAVQGESRQSAYGRSPEGPGNCGAREYHQEAYACEPAKECSRGHSREGRADSRVERDAALPGMRKAHARGTHNAAGRHKDASLPALQYD